MVTGLLLDDRYLDHDTGERHPEQPARITAVREALAPLAAQLTPVEPRRATVDELARCHDPEYIALAEQDVRQGYKTLSTGDTHISPASYDVAVTAAGGVVQAVDAVLAGELDNAFCAVRPPGHHARPAQGMGFCLFNNVAIAARYAQDKHGVDRVLIVDWDVHHGNGTQDIFYQDGSVSFFSTHQSPWYPGTGEANETGDGNGEGATLNRPLPAGSGSIEIVGALEEFLPRAREFRPQLVLISAGFDSRAGDPLGNFLLTDEDFAVMTRRLLDLAAETADGRLVSVLEGGYSLTGLAAACAAHVTALTGQ